jgi:hypothetical protein
LLIRTGRSGKIIKTIISCSAASKKNNNKASGRPRTKFVILSSKIIKRDK